MIEKFWDPGKHPKRTCEVCKTLTHLQFRIEPGNLVCFTVTSNSNQFWTSSLLPMLRTLPRVPTRRVHNNTETDVPITRKQLLIINEMTIRVVDEQRELVEYKRSTIELRLGTDITTGGQQL